MFRSVLSLLQALLFLVSSFSVVDSKFKRSVDTAVLNVGGKSDFSFESISDADMKLTDSEKQLCRDWYEANIINAGTNGRKPAYDFTVGGKSLRKNLGDWDFDIGTESEAGAIRKGGKTTYITLRHKRSDITATVEATIYEENATCEWCVYIKNNGEAKSPVVKNFYAFDSTLGTGNAGLYVSKGSEPNTDDFELFKMPVNLFPMLFNANGGRNDSYLPYFNITGKYFSAVMSIGWTGQWRTTLRQTVNGVKINAKQEELKGYLAAGEEIRSPLVTLSFYQNKNPLKGFNMFREWERDCVYPDSIGPLNGFVIANEFSTKTCDELIEEVNNVEPSVLESTDYFWMDAGWYKYTEGWHDGVGNWIPDESRFPDGLKPLADAMKAKGKRFLLWYEPERVRENTYLYNEGMKHDDWIVQIKSDLLWNLGNDDACDFLSKYIAKSLVDNGVTMYRQDFNFVPLKYWQTIDKKFNDGRKGICENHYVTNLYKYLDYLCESVDGLIIDNCASGGKRLDTEMTRRSLPLWRSDYNCGRQDGSVNDKVLEATQSMTYGLSCWLDYSGTNRYFHSEYASRCGILTNQSVYQPVPTEYTRYSFVSNYMTENYYPLTYGGTDLKKYLAMQFGDADEGAAVIYKREKVKKNTYVLKLNGLSPESEYILTDIDKPGEEITRTGAELMTGGVTLVIKDTPKAVVIRYSVK